jgi:hypothetical protein
MSVAWEEMLRQIEPNYGALKDIMENGPKIVAVMRTFNRKWRVRIEEDWSRNGDQYYTADFSNLDIRCDWAANQLTDWKFVRRISHQEWVFLNRNQAEKFLTIFNLKWACQ